MGGHHFDPNSKNSQRHGTRLLASACAGGIEISFFHPVDTIAKRLQVYQGSVNFSNASDVIYRGSTSLPFQSRVLSLFTGIRYAALYKVCQRSLQFGGQPIVTDWLSRSEMSNSIRNTVGNRYGTALANAIAGSLVGVAEIQFLPLDALKVKSQTNPASLALLRSGGNSSSSFVMGVITQFPKLYRGAGWTATRNAVGSFTNFGGIALVKEKDQGKASVSQNFVASTIGATICVTTSAPLDVIKTRVQKQSLETNPSSGFKIASDLIRNEGIGAFFKGVIPKVVVVGPRLVFSYTLSQYLMKVFSEFQMKPTMGPASIQK